MKYLLNVGPDYKRDRSDHSSLVDSEKNIFYSSFVEKGVTTSPHSCTNFHHVLVLELKCLINYKNLTIKTRTNDEPEVIIFHVFHKLPRSPGRIAF